MRVEQVRRFYLPVVEFSYMNTLMIVVNSSKNKFWFVYSVQLQSNIYEKYQKYRSMYQIDSIFQQWNLVSVLVTRIL